MQKMFLWGEGDIRMQSNLFNWRTELQGMGSAKLCQLLTIHYSLGSGVHICSAAAVALGEVWGTHVINNANN